MAPEARYPSSVQVELDLQSGWHLEGGDLSAPEAALAAAELEAALGPPVEEGIEVTLTHAGETGDGFSRRATSERIELRGDSPRGLLFGVYETLEELGEGWPWPGEHRSRRGAARLEDRVDHRPAVPGRCIVLGECALVQYAEDWIEWAARNRLNGVFVHVSTQPEPHGAAAETAWEDAKGPAVALARERGMTLEHGGHLLPELLSGADLRALAAGDRPGPAAERALSEHVRDHPEADVLHLWGADLPAGAGGAEASEAALRTANAVAELAEAIRPGIQVAFLAYHDTIEVPRSVPPRQNVCLVFAPRERCYEHTLADPGCPTNARYRDTLAAQVEHFDAAGAAAPRVFEYWLDAILFAGGVPDLTETMAGDLAFYRQAGVDTVEILITGHGDAPAPHPNLPAFARLAWRADADRTGGR